jgi:hypothetical protein
MTINQSYRLGYDCGLNGPNTTNSHFSIFAKKENTAAWEKGKAAGEKDGAKRLGNEPA